MSQKHHVTIEEVIDQDDLQCNNQLGGATIDINQINSDNTRGSKRQAQAWNEVDAMEEQARNEKLEDQSRAMRNAAETARIVKEAQQSSGY
ncbi:hypothetical protein K501DRAFT_230869 [Backusella circina FSU 941]|nr:hypothetical protein K501DRAFT_230869 [Backusella circina FSU 941]